MSKYTVGQPVLFVPNDSATLLAKIYKAHITSVCKNPSIYDDEPDYLYTITAPEYPYVTGYADVDSIFTYKEFLKASEFCDTVNLRKLMSDCEKLTLEINELAMKRENAARLIHKINERQRIREYLEWKI